MDKESLVAALLGLGLIFVLKVKRTRKVVKSSEENSLLSEESSFQIEVKVRIPFKFESDFEQTI